MREVLRRGCVYRGAGNWLSGCGGEMVWIGGEDEECWRGGGGGGGRGGGEGG